ncbi:MAG: F0F1 ATP synthase subunit epsilon [Beijerinckiaceae bacterium]|jgi:F-type H+-transporting ATPase subunit epsilon
MPTFPFELVSPEKLLFSGEVEAVVVPGSEGEFTVLKNHSPLMSVLKPGIVEIDETTTRKSKLFVRGGFADVSARGLTILAEFAIPLEELDSAKIDAGLKDAEDDVADAENDEARRLATEKRDQLLELKAALGI